LNDRTKRVGPHGREAVNLTRARKHRLAFDTLCHQDTLSEFFCIPCRFASRMVPCKHTGDL
jgi:hypothetical protein